MSDKTKIIIVRHGESLGNAQGRLLGHTDLDLSPLGFKQARVTAEHLKDEKIDIIYSSDLKRAYNTALEHAKLRNLPVVTDIDLREVYHGDWEGKTVSEVVEKYGDMLEREILGNFVGVSIPGGESFEAAGERFFNAVQRIAEENAGKTVLIGAHGAIIRVFWVMISGISPDEIAAKVPLPTNSSYQVAYYSDGKFTPYSYSNDAHLAGVGITNIIEK